ncbi:MAG: histidine phosphatase family protein [Nocardioidaceae bacterium]|nr:histidine phosphatase family protein [Nocardioidaceae bacterium]
MTDAAELWIVRHGATEWSRNGRHTSTTDLPLLPDGEDEARRLAPRLADVEFAAVFSSPRARALRTAELAGFPEAEVDQDLAEWSYGDYEGRTGDDIRGERPGWSLWSDGAPGGETGHQVSARLDRVVAEVEARGGRTLVFAHGHSSRALAARWLGRPVADGGIFHLDTATLSQLGHEHGRRAVVRWNA